MSMSRGPRHPPMQAGLVFKQLGDSYSKSSAAGQVGSGFGRPRCKEQVFGPFILPANEDETSFLCASHRAHVHR